MICKVAAERFMLMDVPGYRSLHCAGGVDSVPSGLPTIGSSKANTAQSAYLSLSRFL